MNRDTIIQTLKKFDFVMWDRYFGESESLTFYGWIKRTDKYKDFLILDFGVKPIWWATSSEKYSKKIAEILNQDHSRCYRVEYFMDGNVIEEATETVQSKNIKDASCEVNNG